MLKVLISKQCNATKHQLVPTIKAECRLLWNSIYFSSAKYLRRKIQYGLYLQGREIKARREARAGLGETRGFGLHQSCGISPGEEVLACTNVFMLLTEMVSPSPASLSPSWKTREAEMSLLLRIQASLRKVQGHILIIILPLSTSSVL